MILAVTAESHYLTLINFQECGTCDETCARNSNATTELNRRVFPHGFRQSFHNNWKHLLASYKHGPSGN